MTRHLLRKLKNWYFDLPIARKINLTTLLVVMIPLIGLALFANFISSQIIIEKTIHASILNLDLITESINRITSQANNYYNAIASNDLIQDVLKQPWRDVRPEDRFAYNIRIGSYLDSIVAQNRELSSVMIYGQQGQLFNSGRINPFAVDSRAFLQSRYFRLATSKWGQPVWRDTHPVSYLTVTNNPGADYLSLIRHIYHNQQGKIIGSVEINIDERTIAALYSRLNKDGRMMGRYFIVNRDGMVVSAENSRELYRRMRRQKYLQWALHSTREGRIFRIGRSDSLVIAKKVTDLDWTVVGLIPLTAITRDNSKATYFIFLSGLVCICLAVGSTFLISHSITRPITDLSRLMGHAARGNLQARAKVAGNDEVGALSGNFNNMLEQITGLMEQVYQEQRQKRELELKALQAQINPHFLYNTLESVCSLAQLGRTEDVFRMVRALEMFYRIVLSKGRDVIAIGEEIDNVRNYLTIQSIRYAGKFEYRLDIEAAILNQQIIKLTIQPLVENAIYHGLKNKRGKGNILIEGRKAGERIVIAVRDDGIGMKTTEIGLVLNEESAKADCNCRSFGLRNVAERIKLYFGPQYGIAIESQPGVGTCVTIILPYTTDLLTAEG